MRWSSSFPTIFAFAQQRGARLPHRPVPGFLTGPRVDASPAFACAPARRVARLSTRPTPFEVAETFTPELAPPQVTPRRSRVALRSCLDPCCGGTCTRWESAVMGCNFASEQKVVSLGVGKSQPQGPWARTVSSARSTPRSSANTNRRARSSSSTPGAAAAPVSRSAIRSVLPSPHQTRSRCRPRISDRSAPIFSPCGLIYMASLHKSRYSMISSARASTDGGIVKPSAFAALRLMTNSNFVGRSTGRSAAFAPSRILPV